MWSCGPLNSTAWAEEPSCRNSRSGSWVLSSLYSGAGVPVSLGYNALSVSANSASKNTMTMPDVYFVNMAVAGSVLTASAPAYSLGPAHSRWASWSLSSEAHVTSLISFNVASSVTMYSTASSSLDYYIERASPRTYMASVYNTRHVCGFVWGGAVLTSFSSSLFYICSHVSSRIAECARMQNTEAADAILVVIGYVVPGSAVLYASALISRIGKEDTPSDQDTSRSDPSVHRSSVATVCTQFGLWTPYYLSSGHTVSTSRGRTVEGHYSGILQVAKDSAKFSAFSSSSVTPSLYRYINKAFPGKLRRSMKKMHCGRRHCSPDPSGIQQVMAQA